jgi:YesN/AraC family two-component response regulator
MAGKKLTVLLVDDSRTVLTQIQSAFEASEKAEIVGTAKNGAEAIQRASELKPDLVIMDIVMPDMDGLAALRILLA